MTHGLLLPLQLIDEEAGVLRLVFKAFALVFGVTELLAQLGYGGSLLLCLRTPGSAFSDAVWRMVFLACAP